MTQWWSNDESRQMHNQPRHHTWCNNSIFGPFHLPNTHWLLAVEPIVLSFSGKSREIFLSPMGIKISHVENYSIYVGYGIRVLAAQREIGFGPRWVQFCFFVHRSARGRKISQYWRLRAAPSTIEPLIWVALSQSIFGLWWPSLVTTSLN